MTSELPREFGYRAASQTGNALWWRLSQSPPGRQLAIDGTLVFTIVTWDPGDVASNTTHVSPDGTRVTYIRAGVQESWSYTRQTGWQQT